MDSLSTTTITPIIPSISLTSELDPFLLGLLQFIGGDGNQLQDLAKSSTPSVCGLVWKPNEPAYKCRTCEMDPTCAICVACFRGGNHEGHDYHMIRTGGGCCDCGDLSAWSKEGCCVQHQGAQDNPDLALPVDMRSRAQVAFSLLAKRLSDALDRGVMQREEAAVIEITGTISWLTNVLKKYGEGLSRAWVNVLVTRPPLDASSPSLLNLMVEIDADLPIPLRERVHNLFFQLLTDTKFKKEFAKEIARQYQALELEYCAKRSTDVNDHYILEFDVQLFTVRELGTDLATKQDQGLLEIILGVLKHHLSHTLVPSIAAPSREVIDPEKTIVVRKRLYAKANIDLGYILTHPAVARWMIYEREDLLQKYLDMLAFCQGMDPVVRAADVHVLFESESWRHSFQLVLDLCPHFEEIIVGFLSGPEPLAAPYALEPFKAQASPAVLSGVKQVLEIIAREVVRQTAPETSKFINIEEGYISTTYDVLTQPISLHNPLNRFLSQLLSVAMNTWGYSMQELLGNNSVCQPKGDAEKIMAYDNLFPLAMLDKVATVLAFEAQVRAGLWKKNGDTIRTQLLFYRPIVLSRNFYYDSDLLILQQFSCLLEPDHFLWFLLNRFGLQKWFELEEATKQIIDSEAVSSEKPKGKATPVADKKRKPEKKDAAEEDVSMADQFICLLIVLVRNRSHCNSLQDKIKQEIIHRLAVAPHTHSNLQKTIHDDLHSNAQFDTVLKQVSSYALPQGMGQGKYSLKPEYWNEWDPYFYHYDTADQQSAIERYDAHCKSLNKTKLPFPKPGPMSSLFMALTNVLQSRVIHNIIYVTLQDFLTKSSRITEDTLTHALHLLHLCLYFAPPTSISSQTGETAVLAGLNFPSGNIFENSRIIVSSPKCPEGESLISMLLRVQCGYVAYKETVKEILDLYIADAKCAELIQKATQQAKEEGMSAEDKEKLRKQRQQEIMNKFAAQQKAFLAKSHEMLEDSDSDEESNAKAETQEVLPSSRRHHEQICVMCREATKVSEKPIGYISLLSRSDLLPLQLTQKWENFEKEKLLMCGMGKGKQKVVPTSDAPSSSSSSSNNNNNNNNPDTTTTTTATAPVTKTTTEPRIEPGSESEQESGAEEESGTESDASEGKGKKAKVEKEEKSSEEKEKEVAKLASKALEKLVASVAKDNEASPGVSILPCSHVLHVECYQQYYTSIIQRQVAGLQFEGSNEINIPKGEFLCPLCRGIANAVIPILEDVPPPTVDIPDPFSTNTLLEWHKSCIEGTFPYPTMPGQVITPNLSLAVRTFSARVYTFLKGVFFEDVEERVPDYAITLWNTLAVNISHIELASRDSNKFLLDYTSDTQYDFLQNLALLCVSVDPAGTVIMREGVRMAILKIIFSSATELKLAPLLKLELYDVFVRYVFSVSNAQLRSFEEVHPCLQMLYYANVVQAIHMVSLQKELFDRVGITIDHIQDLKSKLGDKLPEISNFSVLHHMLLMDDLQIPLSPSFVPVTTTGSTEQYDTFIKDRVSQYCLPFLRKVGLFAKACLQIRETNPRREFANPNEEFKYWVDLLHLPTFNDDEFIPPTVAPVLTPIIYDWLSHANRRKRTRPEIRKLTLPVPFKFIDLPIHYTDLFTMFMGVACQTCNSIPNEPALCLICGRLVCLAGSCCTKESKGECAQHSLKCGGGVGVFLVLKLSYILLIRQGGCSYWGSVYLDQHGEEDLGLKRGRPLMLNEQRYAQLKGLFVTKMVEQAVVKKKYFSKYRWEMH